MATKRRNKRGFRRRQRPKSTVARQLFEPHQLRWIFGSEVDEGSGYYRCVCWILDPVTGERQRLDSSALYPTAAEAELAGHFFREAWLAEQSEASNDAT